MLSHPGIQRVQGQGRVVARDVRLMRPAALEHGDQGGRVVNDRLLMLLDAGSEAQVRRWLADVAVALLRP